MGNRPSSRLSRREQDILNSFRRLAPSQRKVFSEMVDSLSHLKQREQQELYPYLKRLQRVLDDLGTGCTGKIGSERSIGG